MKNQNRFNAFILIFWGEISTAQMLALLQYNGKLKCKVKCAHLKIIHMKPFYIIHDPVTEDKPQHLS